MFKRFEVAVTYSAFGILSRSKAVMRASYHGCLPYFYVFGGLLMES